MEFIVIGDDKRKTDATEETKKLQTSIDEEKKHVFLLIYSNHCGPCIATKPEWDKLEDHVDIKMLPDIVIARIESTEFDELKNAGDSPDGVPTFRHIHEKKTKNYAGGREVGDFVEWIKETVASKSGGKRKTRKTRRAKKRGGKWSLKYKRSINCRKPKGFSQKQHCKGRSKK
jgi:thiol-disulfide isomerase/thioredoxin